MTEYETAYLASEYINRTWDVMQFWASVSFGLIALSYLGQRYLNWLTTGIISVLYLGFTFFVTNILRVNGVVTSGFLEDIDKLAEKGTPVSRGTQAIVDTAPGTLEMSVIMTTFFGLFVGTLIFLWLSCVHANKERRDEPAKDQPVGD